MATEDVFEGSGDSIEFTILNTKVISDEFPDGTPIPFIDNGVVRMDLFVDGSVFSTEDVTPLISYDNNGGIKLTLGSAENMTKFRSMEGTIKAYDETPEFAYPLGQTIVHTKRTDSNLSLIFN